MLAGTPPFDAATALDVMMSHVSKPPTPPSQCSNIHSAFDEPILKMLEKQPEDRPQSMLSAYASLAKAAEKVLGHSVDDKAHASPLLRDAVLERERALPRVVELPKPRLAPAITPRNTSVPQRTFGLPFLIALIALVLGAVAIRRVARTATPPAVASVASVATHVVESAQQSSSPAEASAPPQQATVEITFNTQPARAEIYSNERLLGIAPGPIQFARNEIEMQVVVKATGFLPATVVITPAADQEIKVSLSARAARQPKSGVSRDLENPY
jgi:serine/threonine protein kinase